MEKITIKPGLEKEVLAFLIMTGAVKMESVRQTATFLNNQPSQVNAHKQYFTE